MVTIQPFEYEKTTAFKERVQIANKVNEIISLFNELDIESKINIFNEEIAIINTKITEINNALNEVNIAINTVEGYDNRLIAVENKNNEQDSEINKIENETIEFLGDKSFKLPTKLQIKNFLNFGSNNIDGWYATIKLPKNARDIFLKVFSPGNLNFVLLETNTHTLNVVKWTNYIPNQNKFTLAETNDSMILYVYSATYRTNILIIENYGVYGSQLFLNEIDTSLFTGLPESKPVVGGDIIAVYDENIMNVISNP